MRKIHTYILLLIALMAWAMPAKGEPVDYPMDTIDGQIYYRYTVERSIGLYRISVNFGVRQEDILKANPQLKQKGLQFGDEILIPAKAATEALKQAKASDTITTTESPAKTIKEKKKNRVAIFDTPKLSKDEKRKVEVIAVDSIQQDSLVTTVDTLIAEDSLAADTIRLDSLGIDTLPQLDSSAIRLAFLLPLHADAIKRDKNMERFYDFYAGALIAIYETQANGQMLEVFTYDIGKTAHRTKEILQQHPELREVDAIIGPAYSQQVAMVMDSLSNDSIWMLVPFLSRLDGITTHPNILKFNPSEQIEADTIARYLATRGDSVNCVLVETKEGDVIPSGIQALHSALKREQVPTTTISLRALLTDSIDGGFRDSVENIIIFNTERYANLQTVMPHLLQLVGKYRITLYSHYSWQHEQIILPQLYASVFAQEPIVPEQYQELFDRYFAHDLSSEQPRYDLLGYDLTSHLIHMLQHESSIPMDSVVTPLDEVWEGIQAQIHYQQLAPQGGYENHIMRIIHQ